MKTLYKSISTVKQEIGKISKDKENPFFKSKYFDINSMLEHIEPLLQINGLVLMQPIKDGKVQTIISHIESGEFEYSELQLPELNDPQKLGSAITYFRRYTLQSLLGLQAEDDDGNKVRPQPETPEGTKFSDRDTSKDVDKEWIAIGNKAWNKAIEKGLSLVDLRKYYKVSKANGEQYLKELTKTVK